MGRRQAETSLGRTNGAPTFAVVSIDLDGISGRQLPGGVVLVARSASNIRLRLIDVRDIRKFRGPAGGHQYHFKRERYDRRDSPHNLLLNRTSTLTLCKRIRGGL